MTDIRIRKASARGGTRLDWLDSRHSFSFGGYMDPEHMGHADLRVINQDVVAPGRGFGRHGHRDMEILTYVLSGTLAHTDSLGNSAQIRPGEIQRMSAGTGIEHAEYNPSDAAPVEFLQIWILPDARGLAPSYEQVRIAEAAGPLTRIASPAGGAGQVRVHQDVTLLRGLLGPGETARFTQTQGRTIWLQMVRGRATLGHAGLEAGDGAAFAAAGGIDIVAGDGEAEFLLFDLRG